MLQHLLYGFHVFFALALSVDEDVIEVHYHKNVEFFGQDLVDVALESGWYVGQSKRYILVIKVAIAGSEGRLLFVDFSNSHSMIGIG